MKNRIVLSVLLFLFAAFLLTCNDKQPEEGSLSGEELARIHCASCHLFPEPALLDKPSWDQHVLPRMGYMLGVLPEDSIPRGYLEPEAREMAFANPMLFRKQSMLTEAGWQKIRQYYTGTAPATAPRAPRREIAVGLDLFRVQKPELRLSPPSSTMVRLSGSTVLVGDANTRRIYQFDKDLNLLNAANVREGAVWLDENEEELRLLVMGSFSPTDHPSGLLLSLPKVPGKGTKVLIDSLRRPVHSDFGDLNGDGREDIVICEFAKWTGKLSWWEQGEDGAYREHVIKNMPGPIKSYIRDMDQDGWPDVVALFAQGDEGISIFYNQGNGRFREDRVLRFPPAYGSSFFNFCDLDGDEHPDIVYTNGDNADFPPILKAYHGIRLYRNDGKNQFEEVLFYPQYGAYGAVPADFDEDGDIDIAAISFFPDFKGQPEQSFLYLENTGNWELTARTFPGFAEGRWIVVDAGDPDGDGDLDLVLGSLAFEVIPKMGLVEQWVQGGLPFVLLENRLR